MCACVLHIHNMVRMVHHGDWVGQTLIVNGFMDVQTSSLVSLFFVNCTSCDQFAHGDTLPVRKYIEIIKYVLYVFSVSDLYGNVFRQDFCIADYLRSQN